ncbi:TylF/MycF/NovP-related O-methyltransferase [Candidatus Electronema sp. TJ]|uniref:TylF/MycF/NovP-related O-methyltransferase n=1 Tax=Candidatus Electronema sp. TJ TaxID=3401573 RepID=UPI003AA83056
MKFSMQDVRTQTKNDIQYRNEMELYFQESNGTFFEKLQNFTKYVPRQIISTFLAKHEIFKKVIGIHGHIVECGVFLGGGLMTWANLSAIYEPVNHSRRIIGFDTFEGFPNIHEKDKGDNPDFAKKGGLSSKAYQDIEKCVHLYDMNRSIGHIPRVELVMGDATKTIPEYLIHNKHLVVAMLYLDFDIFEPTKIAIEYFLPRMPKGAVIVFDELNDKSWPGETQAVLETIGISNLKIERYPFVSQFSFAVID